MGSGRAHGRAATKADRPTQTPQVPGQRALPGMADIPTVPPVDEVTSAYVIREDAIRRRISRVEGLKQLRATARALHRESLPPYEAREILVRIVLGRDGVGAVVEWRSPRVGRAGLLHRLAGPLPVDASVMRSAGPVVALRIALAAVMDVTKE